MVAQRRRDTRPELELRRLLYAAGRRYRINYPLPGLKRRTADIAFPRERVAVFVMGCFWHQCPKHGTLPRANGTWWREKLDRNVARDKDTFEQLQRRGWTTVVVWEHEDAEVACGRVRDLLNTRD
jgi:DNA mismatch endonuclease (patch repair protein)